MLSCRQNACQTVAKFALSSQRQRDPTGAAFIERFNQEPVNKALAVFVRKVDSAVQLLVNEDALAQVSLIKFAPQAIVTCGSLA